MRIAHVTATFPPYHSGTGTVCYHNALELARLGHDVTVFTAAYPRWSDADPNVFTVRRLPALFRIGNAPFLPGLLSEVRGFDLIHLHHPFIFGAEMIWAVSRMRQIPYVLTHHNDLIGAGLRRCLFDLYSAVSVPLVFSGARKFAVVSADHAAHCRLARFFRARWDDVVEVPNGVDTDLFRPGLDGSPVRKEHGIPDDARVILFVGALDRAHHFKGVAHLIKAFARLGGQDARLLIVGDGDLKAQFASLADQLELARQVCFAGARSHNQLASYYAASDIVALPSFPPESFGVVLLEAMSCGKPVVASNLPGVRTVVSEGEDGLLAAPGDVTGLAERMATLLEDPGRRREMGRMGRAKVEDHYGWPQIVPRLVEIYEQVVAEGVPGNGSRPIA
ncbi:MAG: glycosyltransferase family 4 protein [Anaerolineae bacterium]|nr:glycosyltransferase family 4 protein [Anaerolineae bacterium]